MLATLGLELIEKILLLEQETDCKETLEVINKIKQEIDGK